MTKHDTIVNSITKVTEEIADSLVAIRRWMHKNPELGFQEVETAAMVGRELDLLGIPWTGGIGGTGICATVEFGPGVCVAIRADIDALPIHEEGTPSYKSKNPGKMHACGHDAHTAILIGVAKVLLKLKPTAGKIMLIFQPSEESLTGARAMLEDGLFDLCEPDVILGYHNWPLLPAGTIGWHPKAVCAAFDSFDITIRGVSGHGAHPHLTKDPIVAAGSLVSSLQMIVSREIAPQSTGVVTVGSISGGTARNQVPDVVRMEGAIRSQTSEVREMVKQAIKRITQGVAIAHGVEISLSFPEGVPPLENDPEILSRVVTSTQQILGDENVVELPQGSMGSEDFAEFSTRKPAAHLRIGSKHGELDTMLHRSDFDLDEDCISTGVRSVAACVFDLLENDPLANVRSDPPPETSLT